MTPEDEVRSMADWHESAGMDMEPPPWWGLPVRNLCVVGALAAFVGLVFAARSIATALGWWP